MNAKERKADCPPARFDASMPASRRRFLTAALVSSTGLLLPAVIRSRSAEPASAASAAVGSGWVSLFDGKSLDGWRPKITGYALGDNHLDTFRVQDGLLKVVYERYEKFTGQFGHLFYRERLSH